MNIGVLYALGALVAFACGDTLLKKVSKFDWFSLTIIRSAVTVLVVAALVWFTGSWTTPSAQMFGIIALLAVLGALSFISFILAMKYWKASLASAISQSFVVIVAVLSWIVTGQTLSMVEYLCIGAIVGGIVVLHAHKSETLEGDFVRNRGFYFALLTFFMWGITFYFIEIPIKAIGAIPTMLYFEIFILAIYLIGTLWRPLLQPKRDELLHITGVGIFLGIAGPLVALAIGVIGPSIANAIIAGSPLGVVILARIFLSEKISAKQMGGILLIVAGIATLSLIS